jgi:hypothetical protein
VNRYGITFNTIVKRREKKHLESHSSLNIPLINSIPSLSSLPGPRSEAIVRRVPTERPCDGRSEREGMNVGEREKKKSGRLRSQLSNVHLERRRKTKKTRTGRFWCRPLLLATALGAVGVPGAVAASLVGTAKEVLVECRVRALESWHIGVSVCSSLEET